MRPNCRTQDLELYAYGFLEGVEKALVESHLEGCPDCRAELDRLWVERQIVSFELSLEPGVTESVPEPPRPTNGRSSPKCGPAELTSVSIPIPRSSTGSWPTAGR